MADFPSEFDEGGGSKNRRLAAGKISIGEVLISRTLSVCGEVAEGGGLLMRGSATSPNAIARFLA
jgi:hypothetical protein